MKHETKWLCLVLIFGLLTALTGCGGGSVERTEGPIVN